jgi:hypothetical protein
MVWSRTGSGEGNTADATNTLRPASPCRVKLPGLECPARQRPRIRPATGCGSAALRSDRLSGRPAVSPHADLLLQCQGCLPPRPQGRVGHVPPDPCHRQAGFDFAGASSPFPVGAISGARGPALETAWRIDPDARERGGVCCDLRWNRNAALRGNCRTARFWGAWVDQPPQRSLRGQPGPSLI